MTQSIARSLDGWKTHILAFAFAAVSVVCWRYGMITGDEAFRQIETAMMGSCVRAAVAKIP